MVMKICKGFQSSFIIFCPLIDIESKGSIIKTEKDEINKRALLIDLKKIKDLF